MLKTYLLAPELLDCSKLDVGRAHDLLSLLGALTTTATFLIPRPDLGPFIQAVGQIPASTAPLLEQLLLNEWSGSGGAIVPLDCPSSSRSTLKRLRDAVTANPHDTVVCASVKEIDHLRKVLGATTICVLLDDALRERTRAPKSVELQKFTSEQAIDEHLGKFFARGDQLIIFDPYIVKKLPTPVTEPGFFELALAKLLALYTAGAHPAYRTLRVAVMIDRSKLKQSFKSADKTSSTGSVLQFDDYMNSAIAECKHSVTRMANAGTTSPIDIEVTIRVSDSFSERGLKSSGRFWNIDHQLDDLGKVLSALRQTKPTKCAARPYTTMCVDAKQKLLQEIWSESRNHN